MKCLYAVSWTKTDFLNFPLAVQPWRARHSSHCNHRRRWGQTQGRGDTAISCILDKSHAMVWSKWDHSGPEQLCVNHATSDCSMQLSTDINIESVLGEYAIANTFSILMIIETSTIWGWRLTLAGSCQERREDVVGGCGGRPLKTKGENQGGGGGAPVAMCSSRQKIELFGEHL